MTDENDQKNYVALFNSVSHVMKAEKLLIAAQIPIKIIPVPKSISSDCGVCIRFEEKLVEKVKAVLNNQFEMLEIRQL
jgi:hypothetical protein